MLEFISAYVENNLHVRYPIQQDEIEIIYNFYLKKLDKPKYQDTITETSKKIKLGSSDEILSLTKPNCVFFYGIFYEIHQNYDKMEHYLQLAAQMNHIGAIVRLSDYYQCNHDNKNYVLYLKQGADLKDPYCLFHLAEYVHIYENNIKQFKKLHKIAANLNYKKSVKALAYYYGVIDNKPKKMIKYYLHAIDIGSVSSLQYLGNYYCSIKEYDLMKKYYIAAIEAGNKRSASLLGDYYLNVEHDIRSGIEYYIQSANLTDPDDWQFLFKKFKKCDLWITEFYKNMAERMKNK
jgi:tetratricopeptide (TPR) repeat protein